MIFYVHSKRKLDWEVRKKKVPLSRRERQRRLRDVSLSPREDAGPWSQRNRDERREKIKYNVIRVRVLSFNAKQVIQRAGRRRVETHGDIFNNNLPRLFADTRAKSARDCCAGKDQTAKETATRWDTRWDMRFLSPAPTSIIRWRNQNERVDKDGEISPTRVPLSWATCVSLPVSS